MKKTLLFLIIILIIFPTVVSAYEVNKSYRIDKEFTLNGVTCIGVDAQENVYLQNLGFNKTAIQVYNNKGEFLYSIRIETNGSYNFKVDDYIWVYVYRADRVVKYSLDGFLLEETDIDYEEFDKDVEFKFVEKNGITYSVKGALGFLTIWKEHNGSKDRMFTVSVKHRIVNALFIIGIIAYVVFALYLIKKKRENCQRPEYSELELKREDYNWREQNR